MTRSRNVLVALTALVLSGVWAGAAGAATKVVLGYTGANDFTPSFVGKDQGLFERRGLDVTLQRIAVGSTIPAALVADSLQIGTLTAPVTLQAIEGGLDLQIISAATIQSSRNPTAIVVAREGSNIRQAADFRGKKVGVPGLNGVNHVMFAKWLKEKGVDLKAVTFVETPFAQMPDLMKSGQVDAALPVEPFQSRIIQGKIGYAAGNYFAEVRDNLLFPFYAATRRWVEANPKTLREFREALREAIDFIAANRDKAKESESKYLGLPLQVVRDIRFGTFALEVKLADVQFWIDTCRELGVIKGALDASSIVTK